MAKYRFEVVLEYPDDMHTEDVLDLAQESIMGEIQSMSLDNLKPVSSTVDVIEIGERLTVTLKQYGFLDCAFHNLLEDISCIHFLRGNERITIETAPNEDPEIIEAIMDGLEKEEGQLPCKKLPHC